MSLKIPDQPAPLMDDVESRLLNALANLNRIGDAINRIGRGDALNEREALRLVVEGAIQVVPGASAVIYIYDPETRVFLPGSRVSAGQLAEGEPGDVPRPDGMGWRAIHHSRLILSYHETNLTIDPHKVKAGARAVACFPLVVADEPLGVLYIYIAEERHFSSMELLMLQNFVNQAAMALFQIQRMAEVSRYLARKEEELERLRRAGLIISSRLGLEDTLAAILEMALEVISAQYGIFRLLDQSGGRLVTQAVAGAGLGHPYVQALSLDSPSISSWVVRHRQPVLISDLSAEPWADIYYPFDANLVMQSELAVPLISASGRILGVLNLESPYRNAFSDDDRILLQSFATQAVIAIQEVRLLDALQEIPQMLVTQTLDEVLDRLTLLACDLINAPTSAIWLSDPSNTTRFSSYQDGARDRLYLDQDSFHGLMKYTEISLVPRAEVVEHLAGALDPGVDWSHIWVAPLSIDPEHAPAGVFCVFVLLDQAGQSGGEWEKKVIGMLSHFCETAIWYSARQAELRTAQEQRALAEMFAAVGDLATNLLHQLNNKVGTIPVRVQGIQDKSAGILARDPYLANNLAEIERSASEAMAAVRQNLMHLHPVQMVPVSLAECVASAVETARHHPGLKIELNGLDQLPDVPGGQQSLRLVFDNLIENAAQAMNYTGTITIRGQKEEDHILVAVSDQGPGIPQDLHERIFDLNYSSGSRSQPGKLGFGLWWVRALMVRLGGAVWVESDGTSGTTFTLRFPREFTP